MNSLATSIGPRFSSRVHTMTAEARRRVRVAYVVHVLRASAKAHRNHALSHPLQSPVRRHHHTAADLLDEQIRELDKEF